MSVRAVKAPGRYETADEVAQLAQSMRGEMLAWARRRFPTAWDHEEVLQEALTAAALDSGVRGDTDHVRSCLYSAFSSRLLNRFRDERLRAIADAPLDADAVQRIADDDEAIDPPTRALQAWHRAVVEDLLAPYSDTEQKVIRLRYRGGERARKMDGVVSRKQCAQILGLELAQVRSIEDRVIRRLDKQIAAYDRTCQRREKEIELAARRAAGDELSDELLARVEIGLRHLKVCGHCRHTFSEHRRRFATEIAILVPVPAVVQPAPLEAVLNLGRDARRGAKAFRDFAEGTIRDPVATVQLATPRGTGAALLAACGIAIGGAGVCELAGVDAVDRARSALHVESPGPARSASNLRTATPHVRAVLPGTSAFDVFLGATGTRPSAGDNCEACAERAPGRDATAAKRRAAAARRRERESVATAALMSPAPIEPSASAAAPTDASSEPQSQEPSLADACEACAERGGG